MKEFLISPPSVVLYLAGAAVLVALLAALRKKSSAARKAVGIGITVVVAGMIVLLFYRPVTITVARDGVAVSGIGGVDLGWDEVESAVFVPDLRSSPFRPTVRTRGIAIGEYRSGRFLLSNGDPARVFMVQSQSAVVLRTVTLTYVLSPGDVDGLARAIDTYRVYGERGGGD